MKSSSNKAIQAYFFHKPSPEIKNPRNAISHSCSPPIHLSSKGTPQGPSGLSANHLHFEHIFLSHLLPLLQIIQRISYFSFISRMSRKTTQNPRISISNHSPSQISSPANFSPISLSAAPEKSKTRGQRFGGNMESPNVIRLLWGKTECFLNKRGVGNSGEAVWCETRRILFAYPLIKVKFDDDRGAPYLYPRNLHSLDD